MSSAQHSIVVVEFNLSSLCEFAFQINKISIYLNTLESAFTV